MKSPSNKSCTSYAIDRLKHHVSGAIDRGEKVAITAAPLTMAGHIKIQTNTDAIDIDQKCVGLDSWIDADSAKQLNRDRGLHIQIRHNGSEDQFLAAVAVSNRIKQCVNGCDGINPDAVPDVLEALKGLFAASPHDMGDMLAAFRARQAHNPAVRANELNDNFAAALLKAQAAIAKVEGRES